MEFTKEQELFAQVVNKAWDDADFKRELIANPKAAIEKVTGEVMTIPEGCKIVVRDQSDESTVFINIPASKELDVNVELSDSQLEAVSAGDSSYSKIIGLNNSPLHGCFPDYNED